MEGPPGHWREIVTRSVQLAREGAAEAGRPGCAVALSLWLEPMQSHEVRDIAQAIVVANPDLILVETMETIPLDLEFPGYETLLETGLPLWVSYRWTSSGPSDTRRVGINPHAGSWQVAEDSLFGNAAHRLEEIGVDALLVNCLPRNDVPGTIEYLRAFTNMPLGAIRMSAAFWTRVGSMMSRRHLHSISRMPERGFLRARRSLEAAVAPRLSTSRLWPKHSGQLNNGGSSPGARATLGTRMLSNLDSNCATARTGDPLPPDHLLGKPMKRNAPTSRTSSRLPSHS